MRNAFKELYDGEMVPLGGMTYVDCTMIRCELTLPQVGEEWQLINCSIRDSVYVQDSAKATAPNSKLRLLSEIE